MKKTLLCAGILAASSLFVNVAEADVVTSIKPLAFISAAIADGVTGTEVLVKGNQSPHSFALTPQLLQTAKNADVLVYVSPDMEFSIGRALENGRLAPKHVVELGDDNEIKEYLVKGFHYHDEGDEHHHHDHDEHEHKHDHDHDHNHNHGDHDEEMATPNTGVGYEGKHVEFGINYHIWNSPKMARIVARDIADELVEVYPAKRDLIYANLDKFNQSLDETVATIKEKLQPESLVNYYVNHDAYNYFEEEFGFRSHNKGIIYFNLSIEPSASLLSKLHRNSRKDEVKVIFTEPQFNNSIATKLARSVHAKLGQLDTLGSNIEIKPGSFNTYLLSLAEQFSVAKKEAK